MRTASSPYSVKNAGKKFTSAKSKKKVSSKLYHTEKSKTRVQIVLIRMRWLIMSHFPNSAGCMLFENSTTFIFRHFNPIALRMAKTELQIEMVFDTKKMGKKASSLKQMRHENAH